MHIRVVSIAVGLAFGCMSSLAQTADTKTKVGAAPEANAASKSSQDSSRLTPNTTRASLPCEAFTHLPGKPHDPTALLFTFDQLEHWYRVPGEFTHRLDGDRYGFETMSFIISETHPGGGPGLHVHDTEEAHILLQGTAQYQIGDRVLTVQAPYVARVPAEVPHTFINVGTEPFNLIAVFATSHPNTTRIGPHPLISVWQSREGTPPCRPLQ